MRVKLAGILAALLLLVNVTTSAVQAAGSEIEELRAEVARLREAVNSRGSGPSASAVDTMMDSKYGPDAGVTTGKGKLTMGGLVQVWYSSIQNDSQGLFHDPAGTGVLDTNTHADNDSFRVRRAELRFDMAIHENVSAYVMIDPAAEAASYPQSAVGQKRLANISPEFNALNGPLAGATSANVAAVQTGAGAVPNLLQDAIINFHGIIPHHDFTIGQMLNTFNEDNFADNGELDFVERAFIGNGVSRDIGAVLHGSWWCSDKKGGTYQGAGDSGRFQYWLGAWNGAGNLHGTAGAAYNRSDDNDHKDFVGTLLLRPIWNDCWGKLELGYSFRGGYHGESGSGLSATAPVNGLNRQKSWSMGHDGWAKYYAPGALKGLWLKGEATWQRDRNAGGSVIDPVNNAFQLDDGSGVNGDQARIFSTFGYWGAIGYKFADSPIFCNCGHSFWKNFEVAVRYEDAPNVIIADPGRSDNTNVYHSRVITPGINYYIKGSNAKIQANYNFVDNPDGPNGQRFHNTRNDSFVVNFQVMW